MEEIVAELRAHAAAGTLTPEIWLDAFSRAVADLNKRDVGETEDRERELRPLWRFGELVGCLRE